MGSAKFKITGGFLLMVSLLFCFDRQNLLPWFLVSALLHEAGHLLAIYGVGGRVSSFRLTAAGAVIVLDHRARLSYPGELAAALAGPGAGFLAALIFAWVGKEGGGNWAYLFSGMNFVLSVFNLLPVRPLDGGRVLYFILALLFSPYTADAVCRVVSAAFIVLICAAGVLLLVCTRGNISLLAAGLWLLASARGEKSIVKRARSL